MCNIFKTADRRVIRKKIVTRGPRNCICRVVFMSDALSSVWGDLVCFAKFPMLYSKGYCAHIFHPILQKYIYERYGNQGKIQAVILRTLKKK